MARGRPVSKAKKLKSYQGEPNLPSRVDIDWDLVEKWVIGGASGLQVAAALGIHHHTLYGRVQKDHRLTWTEYARDKTEKGNRMLHNKQFEKAMNGSDKMLIHLGEHRLGQIKKIESKVTGTHEISQKAILELPDNGNRIIPDKTVESAAWATNTVLHE